MHLPIQRSAALPLPIEGVPLLETGDRLTCAEFERRYDAMPGLKKAELIEGVVFVPSPVRLTRHGQPHGFIIVWLGNYAAATPGLIMAPDSTIRLDLDNSPQPDAMLMIDPACGGQARIDADDYVVNAPELLGEVSASTVSYDLNVKLQSYQRNGVREYVVWRVQNHAIDWFVLRDSEFVPMQPDADGFYRSEVFPGLWLDPTALLEGNMTRVLDVLEQGMAGTDHAAFIARLKAAAASN